MCQLRQIHQSEFLIQVKKTRPTFHRLTWNLLVHLHNWYARNLCFTHAWIQALRCGCWDPAPAISQLSFPLCWFFIDKHFLFYCKMVATSWTDFLKSPTSGKKREPPFLKSLNEAFESDIEWCLISHGPHCTTCPVPYPVLWPECGILCGAGPVSPAPPCLAERRKIDTPSTRTVSIGGGVGHCPQRRVDPDH